MVTDEMLRQCERFLRLVNDRIEADGKIGRGALIAVSDVYRSVVEADGAEDALTTVTGFRPE